MLYIFDLGNVVIDVDFNRTLGVWSDFSRTPLATLQGRFGTSETVFKYERGEISDQMFADALCEQLGIALSYQQFCAGWQAIFVGIREEVIAIIKALRKQGGGR